MSTVHPESCTGIARTTLRPDLTSLIAHSWPEKGRNYFFLPKQLNSSLSRY